MTSVIADSLPSAPIATATKKTTPHSKQKEILHPTLKITKKLNNLKDGSKKKKKNYDSFVTFIFRTLKSIHPEIGISKAAMDVLNSFVFDMFDRIILKSSSITHYNRRKTVSSREIEVATRFVFPRDLAEHILLASKKMIIEQRKLMEEEHNNKKKSEETKENGHMD